MRTYDINMIADTARTATQNLVHMGVPRNTIVEALEELRNPARKRNPDMFDSEIVEYYRKRGYITFMWTPKELRDVGIFETHKETDFYESDVVKEFKEDVIKDIFASYKDNMANVVKNMDDRDLNIDFEDIQVLKDTHRVLVDIAMEDPVFFADEFAIRGTSPFLFGPHTIELEMAMNKDLPNARPEQKMYAMCKFLDDIRPSIESKFEQRAKELPETFKASISSPKP